MSCQYFDIVMAFDELVALPAPRELVKDAMDRSMRWAARSRAAFDAGGEHAAGAALFGIQQGGLDERLRAESATALRAIGYTGYLSAEVFAWPDAPRAAEQTIASFRRVTAGD